MNKQKPTTKRKRLTASAFEALPDAEKDRIYDELDAQADTIFQRAKPLTAWQKRALAKGMKRLGRPKLGKAGTQIISATIEKDLLKEANAFARAHGMNRSELISEGLRRVMGKVA